MSEARPRPRDICRSILGHKIGRISEKQLGGAGSNSKKRKKPPGRYAVRLSCATAGSTSGSAAFLGKKPDDFFSHRASLGRNRPWEGLGTARPPNWKPNNLFHRTCLLLPDAVRRVFHETRTISKRHGAVCDGELKGWKKSRRYPERHGQSSLGSASRRRQSPSGKREGRAEGFWGGPYKCALITIPQLASRSRKGFPDSVWRRIRGGPGPNY